ncbi:nucleotidyltransferase domain-containing protein [bacterium]|nr:nucleotidyltransferase domain-containing protein [candidate division CSSED10-310 bacterium]
MANASMVVENIVSAYRAIPGVMAIALFGSRARGTENQYSDINLMIVESNSPTQSTRASVLAQLSDPGQPATCRDIPIPADAFQVDGFLVTIWHINEDLICDRVASVVKGRRMENSVIVAILNESTILWDPRKQLQTWKSSVNPVPESYTRGVIPMLFSEVTHILESLNSSTPSDSAFFIQHELIAALTSLYEIIFLLNNEYLILNDHMDHEILRLARVPDDFLKHIQGILSLDNSFDGQMARRRRICLLTLQMGRFIESIGSYNLKAGWVQLRRAAPFLFEFSD